MHSHRIHHMNLILLTVSCGDVLKSSLKCLQVNMGVAVQVGGIKNTRKEEAEVNKGAAQLENVRGCKWWLVFALVGVKYKGALRPS